MSTDNLEDSTIGVIKEENPLNEWHLGKVEKVIKGKFELIRVDDSQMWTAVMQLLVIPFNYQYCRDGTSGQSGESD